MAATKAMTVEEKKAYDKKRASSFKGSIAIMVIYATFILLLALIGVFSESGRNFIFKENFSFTTTFIGGTLFVVALLLIQLLTYKEPVKNQITVDNNVCPDLWELKKTTPAMLQNMNSSVRGLASYYCEAPQNIGIGTSRIAISSIGTANDTDTVFSTMFDDFNLINGTGATTIDSSTTMTCGRIYPEYIANRDEKNFPDTPNTLRCKIINECKKTAGSGSGQRAFGGHTIKWTSVCP